MLRVPGVRLMEYPPGQQQLESLQLTRPLPRLKHLIDLPEVAETPLGNGFYDFGKSLWEAAKIFTPVPHFLSFTLRQTAADNTHLTVVLPRATLSNYCNKNETYINFINPHP